MTTAVRLLLHRHRLLIAAWSVLLIALCGGTVRAYQSAYKTLAQRRLAVTLAQHDAATTVLYGRLPSPGTAAQMFAWEMGAIMTVLAAIMAVLLAVAMTRAAEDDGTAELILGCRNDRLLPARAGCAVLLAVAALLTGGCATGVRLGASPAEDITWPGALAFGAVIGVTFLVAGTAAVLLAQAAAGARQARILSALTVGAAFAVRALADTRGPGWLNWLSPLALRTTTQPFTADHWQPLVAWAAVAGTLAWAAGKLAARRDYRAGLLPSRQDSDARLNIRSGAALAARLSRGTIAAWAIAVTCGATLLSVMGSGIIQQARHSSLHGFLGAQMRSADPVAAYFSYTGTIIGISVTAFAVLGVLRAARNEHDGLTDHVLATGTSRWKPLAWEVAVTAAGSAAILLAAGLASALAAPAAVTGTDVALRAFGYYAGQWPATMAAAGWTALLAGLRPRASWLAWVPLAGCGALALLGPVLGISRPVQDLGIFQHVPDPAAPGFDLGGLAILIAVAAATTVTGLAATTRRDLATG